MLEPLWAVSGPFEVNSGQLLVTQSNWEKLLSTSKQYWVINVTSSELHCVVSEPLLSFTQGNSKWLKAMLNNHDEQHWVNSVHISATESSSKVARSNAERSVSSAEQR